MPKKVVAPLKEKMPSAIAAEPSKAEVMRRNAKVAK